MPARKIQKHFSSRRFYNLKSIDIYSQTLFFSQSEGLSFTPLNYDLKYLIFPLNDSKTALVERSIKEVNDFLIHLLR